MQVLQVTALGVSDHTESVLHFSGDGNGEKTSCGGLRSLHCVFMQSGKQAFYGIVWRSSSEVGPQYFGLRSKARKFCCHFAAY